jgi:hypothetical protein
MADNKSIRNFVILVASITIFFMLPHFISAVPQGPDTLNISASETKVLNTDPIAVAAEAGNITPMIITGNRVTEAWAGYYGNLSGQIVLDDANNFTIYDWNFQSPSGEVYASNGSNVNWGSIYCMNVSGTRPVDGNGSGGSQGIIYAINGSQIELNFGINLTDADGLNETFNGTYTDSTGFQVGTVTINFEDGCSMANPYENQTYAYSGWQELLLTDNESIVFTSLIRNDANSYQPSSAHTTDFQMLVLENGHGGESSTSTDYYFYVELT